MVRKRIIFSILFVFFFFVGDSAAQKITNVTVYFYKSGDSVTVAWDSAERATEYEVELKMFDKWDETKEEQNYKDTFDLGSTTNLQRSFVLPRVGNFEVWVTSIVTKDGEEVERSLPAKSCSDEFSSVDGEKGRWFIHAYLAPPEGLIF